MVLCDHEREEPTQSRSATVTPTELQRLQRKMTSRNTDRSTKFGVSLLQKFLISSGYLSKIEDIPPQELNEILIWFYASLRTENGELYKLNSMKNIRFSIQRFYLEKVGLDLIDSSIFNTS